MGHGGGAGRSAPRAQSDLPPPPAAPTHPGLSLRRSPIEMHHVHLPCICEPTLPSMCYACATPVHACAGGAQEGEEAKGGDRCREVARPAEQGCVGRLGGTGEPACPRGGGKRARVWGEAEGSSGAGQRRAVAQPEEEVGQARAARRQPREGGRRRRRGNLVPAVPRAPCGPGAQPVAACEARLLERPRAPSLLAAGQEAPLLPAGPERALQALWPQGRKTAPRTPPSRRPAPYRPARARARSHAPARCSPSCRYSAAALFPLSQKPVRPHRHT